MLFGPAGEVERACLAVLRVCFFFDGMFWEFLEGVLCFYFDGCFWVLFDLLIWVCLITYLIISCCRGSRRSQLGLLGFVRRARAKISVTLIPITVIPTQINNASDERDTLIIPDLIPS